MSAVATTSVTLAASISQVENNQQLLADLKKAMWNTLDKTLVTSPDQILIRVEEGSLIITFTIVAPPSEQATMHTELVTKFGGADATANHANMAAVLATVPELAAVPLADVGTVEKVVISAAPPPPPPTSAALAGGEM